MVQVNAEKGEEKEKRKRKRSTGMMMMMMTMMRMMTMMYHPSQDYNDNSQVDLEFRPTGRELREADQEGNS